METRLPKSIVWLRNDLRLSDNPALHAACQHNQDVIALFIDETDAGLRPIGGAARVWREQSLSVLQARLAAVGVELIVRRGDAQSVLRHAVDDYQADAVYWNRRYAPAERELDAEIKRVLSADGVAVHSKMGNVLIEPWDVKTGQGNPYAVYTPFWKSLKNMHIPQPLPAPEGGNAISYEPLTFDMPHWAPSVIANWQVGEEAARDLAGAFLDAQLSHYSEERDIPAKQSTSRLSPYLRFGEISPRQVWYAAKMVGDADPDKAVEVDKFLSELAWRDFNYHQLYHRPDISKAAMRAKYDGIPWRGDKGALKAWQTGQTGIPIVDAGMRQLWQTGFMENRVRMLTASLLTKNLLIDWRTGEDWFWDCLFDADGASNPGNWQWVAGCGLDASPYFRVFNPVTQGERFDPLGNYVRQWVPEIAQLPDEFIHAPWTAPSYALQKAGVSLGKTYPNPIVDLKTSRQRALEISKSL
ncbi:deoxyribodipyrimidine photo-lyase [Devosia sp. MC521]|nr:deoxyribodipyrimidine photo-lyase [Devosia sp. MC521]QMW64001.1 deoxyribodipyrimidine photo-lyase [Devosia sp. MC521]